MRGREGRGAERKRERERAAGERREINNNWEMEKDSERLRGRTREGKGRDGDIESGRGCLLPWVHGLGQPAGAVGMQLGALSLSPSGRLCARTAFPRRAEVEGKEECMCVCVWGCCCLIKNANTATP